MKQLLAAITMSIVGVTALAQTTLTNMPYTRFIKQVTSGPGAVIVTPGLAEINASKLQTEDWQQVGAEYSTVPPLNFTSNPLSDSYDAFKYASDYVTGSGVQSVYAGIAAYRFKTPASALSVTSDVASVSVKVYADRWLIGGVRVAAYTSDEGLPTNVWSAIREGSVYTNGYLAVNPTNRVDTNGLVTLSFPGSTEVKDYVYVMLSLEDTYNTESDDSRMLVGGAQIVGQVCSITYSSSGVTADATAEEYYLAQPQLFTVLSTNDFSMRWACVGDYAGILGNDDEADWWSAFAMWSQSGTLLTLKRFAVFNSDIDRIGLRRTAAWGDGAPQVNGCFWVRFGRVGNPVALSRLYFDNSIPAPSSGVVLQLVVYAANELYDRSPKQTELYGNDILAPSTYNASEFWRGAKTEGTWNLSTGTNNFSMTAVIAEEIDTSYSSKYAWDIDWTPTDGYTLIVALSPKRITSNPGNATSVWYGVQWTPGNITLKP